MKHILVTSDLSEASLRPLEAILQWPWSGDSRITLLHVVPELTVAPHGAPLAPPIVSPDLPAEMEEARKALAEQAKKLGGKLPIEAVVISSPNIPIAIDHYATQHDADIIAISTHGRTGWRHLIIGSVAEAVIRHSTVPVMTFPQGKE